MGIGASLAFIAVGAILAFATRFNVSGIDIQMIGWILILVGAAGMAFTLMYTRPRRRSQVAEVVEEEPLYVVKPEEPIPHQRHPGSHTHTERHAPTQPRAHGEQSRPSPFHHHPDH